MTIEEKIKEHNRWVDLHRHELKKSSSLSPVTFSREDFMYVEPNSMSNKDICYCDFSHSYMDGVNCNSSRFHNSTFREARMLAADFSYTLCIETSFYSAIANNSNFSNSYMRNAILKRGSFNNVDFTNTILLYADLSLGSYRNANFEGCDLTGVNLTNADLTGANLSNITYDETTIGLAMVCPEEGSFIGYKCANGLHDGRNRIVKLQIPEYAQRSSATTRQCRCSHAKVLDITDEYGNHHSKAVSKYDSAFIYEVGEEISVDDFDENRWNDCSTGIHFFITKGEAVQYAMRY